MFLIELNLNYDLFGNSCISLGFALELLQVLFGSFSSSLELDKFAQ